MLKIDQLKFSYGKDSEYIYDFELTRGKQIALMGKSGVGKTTLLNLIAGFLEPVSGDILWQGGSLVPLQTRQRPISYMMQDGVLFNHASVLKNLLLSRPPLKEIEKAAEALDIIDLLDQRAGELSGGQRQRVLLAQTLLQKRPIVLLDEPFKGLDAGNKKRAINFTLSMINLSKQSLIFTTHDEREALFLDADKVLI